MAQSHPTKYIIVTGGVISGIGKGVIASSTGLLLRTLGFTVTSIKIDPYLNIDAGTMTPLDHGEVFVLDDGGEVDLDLGNYERFLDITLTRDNNITTGKIYNSVIQKEARCKPVVPHVTNEVQDWAERVAKVPVDESGKQPDICIIELGGTVGDIESAPFIEAMRQFQFRVGHENFCLIHVSLVPVVGSVGEQKTKPTQSSVRDLRGLGLSPDIIACRSSRPLLDEVKSKLSMFCHVQPECVMAVHDCKSVYHVPLLLKEQGLLNILQNRLKLTPKIDAPAKALFTKWRNMTERVTRLHDRVKIILVGKYTSLHDSYISVVKSLEHAALACNLGLDLEWVEAEDLEPDCLNRDPVKYHDAWRKVVGVQGILVPGGFGSRGTEGKIAACKWARTNKIPFLGICLGFQMAVVELARNELGLAGANSDEIAPDTPHPVVINMPEISTTQLGGTMRLGDRVTIFSPDSEKTTIRKLYKNEPKVHERHRHRYEVNPKYVSDLEKHGLKFVGKDEKGERMIIFELEGHPYYVAVQYHPEFKTRPLKPSPPFLGLILAASGRLSDYLASYERNENPNLGRYNSQVFEDL
ncbi:CTP synthase ura7 [Kappamyces sp. JEL0829]|nr:CTP synthase ura7 [Kappamyces sp. JEL0829]